MIGHTGGRSRKLLTFHRSGRSRKTLRSHRGGRSRRDLIGYRGDRSKKVLTSHRNDRNRKALTGHSDTSSRKILISHRSGKSRKYLISHEQKCLDQLQKWEMQKDSCRMSHVAGILAFFFLSQMCQGLKRPSKRSFPLRIKKVMACPEGTLDPRVIYLMMALLRIVLLYYPQLSYCSSNLVKIYNLYEVCLTIFDICPSVKSFSMIFLREGCV